jgi:hypothetical protein
MATSDDRLPRRARDETRKVNRSVMFPAAGGHWENITWENIYGNYAVNLFGFTENHGTGYNQSLGPTNATGEKTKTIFLVHFHVNV